MDLVALPETPAGNRYLLTVTDLFTKYIFLRALRDKSAKSVCDAVLDLFHTFGPPQRIITDQGREFVNAVSLKNSCFFLLVSWLLLADSHSRNQLLCHATRRVL